MRMLLDRVVSYPVNIPVRYIFASFERDLSETSAHRTLASEAGSQRTVVENVNSSSGETVTPRNSGIARLQTQYHPPSTTPPCHSTPSLTHQPCLLTRDTDIDAFVFHQGPILDLVAAIRPSPTSPSPTSVPRPRSH